MKKIVLAFFILFVTTTSFSQGPIAKGQAQFNAGLGLSSWGLPVYVGFDFGVHQDITIGAEATFRSYTDHYKDYRYTHSIFGVSGNANYHFNSLLNIPQNWDFYAGLNVGFYYWNSPTIYYGEHYSGMGIGAQVGGRYYFNDRFGINLELGGGNGFSGGNTFRRGHAFSEGKFGISVRL
jgi:hypothetical protein